MKHYRVYIDVFGETEDEAFDNAITALHDEPWRFKCEGKKTVYAVSGWTVEGVHEHREDLEFEPWTDDKATEFLEFISDRLEMAMERSGIVAGNELIDEELRLYETV